ncbi:NepR family anti-sigma factor [Sphingomicrobium sp. XHP0235]|uniref:NepR family anti-sigma factor n=1 Tax=Sphingomicrobium aquimarinum TaxID=3133971 RepID=UPI0031FEFC0A
MSGKPESDKRDAPAPKEKMGENGKKGDSESVSRVLKTVYDDTLREEIPDEFRDLLSKLG